ncbi:MAG TPA: serine hydrolase [Ramlibacter sp.]|uniref:serine hydrolase domain-containing protein n=1 Tax=Ramlibacter sp. TaxID=1917967 RepID=UPI002D188B7C|nr:serine hydrolase [Ramlibacter sp.]HVZ46799.1 serine hydrolase [Ramlibacter sp.]
MVNASAGRAFRWIGWSLFGLIAATAAIYLCLAIGLAVAYSPTYAWRTLVYGDSDIDDWKRLPSLPVANAAPPFQFSGPADARLPARIRGVTYHRHGQIERVDDLDTFLRETETTAFLVIRDDRLLYEGYFNGHTRDSTETSFSMAKSVTSLLVGIAIDEGRIGSVEDPLRRYLPQLSDTLQPVKLRHVLRMTSGVESHLPKLVGDVDAPWSDDSVIYYGTDLRAFALGVKAAHPPDERFHYNNFNPPLLGLVLEEATGLPVPEYLSRKVWQPLGMVSSATWTVDSDAQGFAKMESGINGRAIDFAKLGRLMLRKGDWDGRRIVSEEWVRRSTQPPDDGVPLTREPWMPQSFIDAGGYYSRMWWGYRRPGAEADYFALGKHGQVIYVSPSKHLVLVRHGSGNHDMWWGEVLHNIADRL